MGKPKKGGKAGGGHNKGAPPQLDPERLVKHIPPSLAQHHLSKAKGGEVVVAGGGEQVVVGDGRYLEVLSRGIFKPPASHEDAHSHAQEDDGCGCGHSHGGGHEHQQRIQLPISCSRAACPNVTSSHNPFSRCSKCGAPYCGKDCQLADWKEKHKELCKPLSLSSSQDSSASESAKELYITKRNMAVQSLFPLVMAEAVVAVVPWAQRLGRGLVVVETKDYLSFAKKDGVADDQLYISYVTVEDLQQNPPSRPLYSHLTSLVPLLQTKYDPDNHMVVVFHDGAGFLFSGIFPLLINKEASQLILDNEPQEVKQMSVFGIDMITGERKIFSFGSTNRLP